MSEMISDARAREIASHWQSPGTHGIGTAQFASTGTITQSLLDDIDREIGDQESAGAIGSDTPDTDRAANLAELHALRGYIDAQTVTAWSVGSNVTGYVPEGDITTWLDYSDALSSFEDMIKEAPEGWYPDGCECDGDDMCDGCSLDAEVKAYIRDDMPWRISPSVHAADPTATPRELLIYLRPEYLPLPTAFWVNRAEMTVAEYRQTNGD